MRKTGNFFKSLSPFLVLIALQVALTLVVLTVHTVLSLSESGFSTDTLLQILLTSSTDKTVSQVTNVSYGVCALFIFGIWYQKVFVKPFRKRRKNYPTGFSFHTIVALICLAFGLQYVCSLVVDVTAFFRPVWLEQYNTIMETAGYGDVSVILAIYSVLLAPIAEELVFRGLIFRYSRHALPFWAANIWQAFLFGVVHLNFIQGIYAFTLGLFMGWICRRGHGIKYTIVFHIIFNILGTFYSGLFSLTTALSYPVFIGIGIALTIFGIWLFYTDFQMEPEGSGGMAG